MTGEQGNVVQSTSKWPQYFAALAATGGALAAGSDFFLFISMRIFN